MKVKDMTTGKPLKGILLFSIPLLLGNLFQQFYYIADSIIVGRFLGEDALAAVGSTGCLIFLVIGFTIGITQGIGVVIANCFGARNMERLKHLVATSILLTVIISILITIPTVTFSRVFLIWMNTPKNTLSMADGYIKVIFAGIIMSMLFNVASNILRGVGDSKTPLYFLVFSSVLNIILDLILIVVMKHGTIGAAYATVIAQGVSALLCFAYMFWKFEILRTRKMDYYLDVPSTKKMLYIGLPMAMYFSITGIGVMVMQSAVNVFGSSAMAAFTAATKVENLAMQPIASIGTAMSTYCGQNLGAGKYDRIYKGMKSAFYLMLILTVFSVGFYVFLGPQIIGWFVSDVSAEVYTYAMQYLHTTIFALLPLAWINLYRSVLLGLNRSMILFMGGFLEMFSRIAIIFFLLGALGYWCIRLVNTITWGVTGILFFVAYYIWQAKAKRTHATL